MMIITRNLYKKKNFKVQVIFNPEIWKFFVISLFVTFNKLFILFSKVSQCYDMRLEYHYKYSEFLFSAYKMKS